MAMAADHTAGGNGTLAIQMTAERMETVEKLPLFSPSFTQSTTIRFDWQCHSPVASPADRHNAALEDSRP